MQQHRRDSGQLWRPRLKRQPDGADELENVAAEERTEVQVADSREQHQSEPHEAEPESRIALERGLLEAFRSRRQRQAKGRALVLRANSCPEEDETVAIDRHEPE